MTIVDERNKYVGIDLSNGDITEAIIEAVEQDNENVKITHLPGYVKIESLNQLVINRATVEEFLGESWNTEDLNLIVTSYYGFMGDWDEDHIIVQWDNLGSVKSSMKTEGF